jgi:hypothetical protein
MLHPAHPRTCSSGPSFGPEAFLFVFADLQPCSGRALARLASKASAPNPSPLVEAPDFSPGSGALRRRGQRHARRMALALASVASIRAREISESNAYCARHCDADHDLFAAVAGSPFSFSCASALYGLFTEAASVNAALASGTRFRLSSANPSRYWLRA